MTGPEKTTSTDSATEGTELSQPTGSLFSQSRPLFEDALEREANSLGKPWQDLRFEDDRQMDACS